MENSNSFLPVFHPTVPADIWGPAPEKQARVKELEREIDKLVYELYGLTDEEIEVVGLWDKILLGFG